MNDPTSTPVRAARERLAQDRANDADNTDLILRQAPQPPAPQASDPRGPNNPLDWARFAVLAAGFGALIWYGMNGGGFADTAGLLQAIAALIARK